MAGNRKLEAVLFDMDGVIIDSEPLWTEAERQLLARRSLEYTPQLKTAMMGRDAKEAVALLLGYYNIDENVDQVNTERNKLIAELFQENLQAVPHVLELLKSVRGSGIKTGLASSSPRHLVDLAVNKLEIAALFDIILSGEQVTQGKPAADIYLAAAQGLEVEPKNCLVIEDAPVGVAAAKNGGMCCLAISTSATEMELVSADVVVRSFEEVDLQLLQSLMRSNPIPDKLPLPQ